MHKLRRFCVRAMFVLLIFCVAIPLTGKAGGISSSLGSALTTLRALGPQSFGYVVQWARNGAPQVTNPIADYEQAEAAILNLGSADRQAVLLWLQGNGRAALYARGATDDQIGPLRPDVDSGATPGPTATPNPWRDLKLASMTLGGSSPSKIAILGGFAAAKRDGTTLIACVSFQNNASVAAKHVVFEFDLLDAGGNTLGKLTLDRTGVFSPGIGIMSFQSFKDWQQLTGGPVNRGYNDNCVRLNNGVAAVPILTARYATYRVTRVEHSDGSVWPSAAASPSP